MVLLFDFAHVDAQVQPGDERGEVERRRLELLARPVLPVALGAPAILDGDLHLVEGPGMVDDRPDPGGIGWKPDAEHLGEPGRDLPDLRRVVVDEDHGVWAELEFGRHLANGAGLR